MPKGGVRTGTPGVAYPNRTDMTKPLPPSASPGGEYGDKIASMRAQQAVPMAAAPAPVVPGGGAAAPTVAPPTPGPPPTPLDAPTQRPNEPITAGLPTGPGPGPEALGMVATPQTLGDLLGRLAVQNPDLATVAAWAQGGRR